MGLIHHYTSINTLSLILKHKTIRFNRLDRVDDVSEARSYDYSLGKFLFVSCWTDSDTESIPLWHMYTDKMRGVRITLDSDWMHYRPLVPNPKYGFIQSGEVMAPVPFDKLINDDYLVLPNLFQKEKVLRKVHYVDDPSQFLNNVVDLKTLPDGKAEMKLRDVNDYATHKDKIWSFQEEVRFALFILPAIPIPPEGFNNEQYLSEFPNHVMNSIINGVGPKLSYFDIEIDPAVIEKVTVTLGPLCDAGDEIIVDSLLAKYASGGTIMKSKLTGTIRSAVK